MFVLVLLSLFVVLLFFVVDTDTGVFIASVGRFADMSDVRFVIVGGGG